MLDPRTVHLAGGINYAVITTLLPDGMPHSNVMWVDTDGEHILMNTEVHRRKFANIEADPRVTVVIIKEGDPFDWVEVRGSVAEVVRGQQARDHIDQLSMKYFGKLYSSSIKSERAILKIKPEREIVHTRR
jgi:PPOX class probable F420-dependent enzyme